MHDCVKFIQMHNHIYIYLFVANANYKNLLELLNNFAHFAYDFV